jgi:hypothetical protein
MVNKGTLKKIRIFAASPGDVLQERARLESLIEQLNRPGEIAEQMGMTLELRDWGSRIDSLIEKDLTENGLVLKEWDLFIGILGSRFESITEKNQKAAGMYSSGTEGEFNYVYNSWKKRGHPRIRLYFCLRSMIPRDIDTGQQDRVRSFLGKIQAENQPTGFYKTFVDITTFKEFLWQDLSDYLKEVKINTLLEEGIKGIPGETGRVDNTLRQLKEGETREIAFLSVGSNIQYQSVEPQAIEKIKKMLVNYHGFVSEIIKKFKGCQIYRGIDGGAWIFWGEDVYDRAASAGIKIIKGQKDFHGNKKLNILEEPLKIRIAAHCASIEIKFPFDKMVAGPVHYVYHLEKNAAPPGTFVITDSFYNKLDNKLKERLNYEKDYENTTLYSFRETRERFRLSDNDLDNILTKVKNNIRLLLNSLEQSVTLKMDEFPVHESMRSYVETIYKNFEYFNQCFSYYFKGRPWKTLSNPGNYIKSLLREDERLLEKFEELNIELKRSDMDKPALLSIKEYVKSIRANSIPYLKFLLHQFEMQAAGEHDIDRINRDYLLEKVVYFVEADPFHEEANFVELLLTKRDLLIDYISNRSDDEWHQRLISRLWQLADFVLIEDKTVKKNRKVFPLLAEDDKKGSYFKVINRFLSGDLTPTRGEIENQFKEYRINPENSDITIVLKSLLNVHQEREIRKSIIQTIGFKNLWYIIAYLKTPLTVLVEIAEFLEEGEKDEERMKIFFDLTLLNLLNHVYGAKALTTLSSVKFLIQVFYKFDFFVETGYFSRLNDLGMRFATKAKKLKIDIEIIEDAKKKLDEYREKRNRPLKTTPGFMHELPLAIQRKLAREGHHIEYFIIHTNPFIASEVNRYINSSNIDRFLVFQNINGTLMKMLLRRKELFAKKSTVYAAMSHRKCTREFAVNHYHQLSPEELRSLADNPNINPAVRDLIKSILQKKQKAQLQKDTKIKKQQF